MVDYLKGIGLENSIIPVGDDDIIPDILAIEFDYDNANKKIQNMRNSSIQYLLNAIKG